MQNKELLEKLAKTAEEVSKVIPDDLGGMVILWGHKDNRQEDACMIKLGEPEIKPGQLLEIKSFYSTSMALFDCMVKDERVAGIVKFAMEEYRKHHLAN